MAVTIARAYLSDISSIPIGGKVVKVIKYVLKVDISGNLLLGLSEMNRSFDTSRTGINGNYGIFRNITLPSNGHLEDSCQKVP